MSWFPVFDRIRALFARNNIYNADNIFQNQSDLGRFTSIGDFVNQSSPASLLEQTNLHINRLERYKDFDQMDEVGEISLALDLYADEASLVDSERKHSIFIKSKFKKVKDELDSLFFDTLLIDNNIRGIIRYLCKYGDCSWEIIPTEHRNGVSRIRHLNIYNFNRCETKNSDLVGFFYQDELASSPQFFNPWQVMHLRLSNLESMYHPYGRCQIFGTRVLTPSGYKNIEDFQKDDKVYSFDGEKLVETRVVAACHSGEKEIYKIKTRHFENNCSGNHPILVRQWVKSQGKWLSELVYRRADELKLGDELVIPRTAAIRNNRNYIKLGSINDKEVIADEKFAKLFGFLIGNGWLNRHKTGNNKWQNKGVEFACDEYDNLNKYYKESLNNYSSNKTSSYKKSNSQSALLEDTTKTYSVDFSNFLENNCGFIQGCKNKRIPGWVYQSPLDVKIAFIDGLIDADGSSIIDEWGCERFQIELANEDLIKDIKLLIGEIGWKCGNISNRERDIITPHTECDIHHSKTWYIYFYKADLFESAGRHVQRIGARGYNIRKKESQRYGTNTLFESIVSIERDGFHQTADIQVEHEASNFIADGIVVHNSILDGARKAFKQLRLMEDAAIIYRLTRAPEKRVFTIPVGNIPTKEIPDVIEMASRAFKKKKIFDYSSNDVTERWSPQIQEDDFWLPQRPGGEGPTIDTLPGAENLDQIADIEYFKKKMIAPLKIPFARAGMGDKSDDSKQSLSQVAPEFGKAVQFIQSIVSIGLKKIALVHLALRGYSIEEMKSFDIGMTASSAIDELYRIEVWKSRAEVIERLKTIGFFKPEWLIATFTDMSLDEIELSLSKQSEDKGGESSGGGGLDLGGLGGEGGGLDLGSEGGVGEIDIGAGIEGVDKGGEADLGLESYNKQENLIFEQAKKLIREEKTSLINTIKLIRESKYPSKPLDYFLSRGELDGLPQRVDETEVIVESYLQDNLIEESKNAMTQFMTEERNGFTSYIDSFKKKKNDSKEITRNDIPEL